jgi:hypothetical protein
MLFCCSLDYLDSFTQNMNPKPRPSIRTWLKHGVKHLKPLEEPTVQRPWWPAGRIGQGHISRRNSLAASRVTPSTRMWPLRPGYQIYLGWEDTGDRICYGCYGCYGFVSKMGDENCDLPLFNGHLKSWDTEFETWLTSTWAARGITPGFRSWGGGWHEEMLHVK